LRHEALEHRLVLSPTLNNIYVTEGSAEHDAYFTLTFSPGEDTSQWGYATSDGTAVANEDYVFRIDHAGSFKFGPDVTTYGIWVPIKGDSLREDDETFYLQLRTDSGTVLAQGMCTIMDDDAAPAPGASVADVALAEGDSGTKSFVFPVDFAAPRDHDATYTYSTRDGTASAGSDYIATSGALTIPAGETGGTIAVPVLGDTLSEPCETFYLDLRDAETGNAIAQARGTMLGDDSWPSAITLAVTDVIQTEGSGGGTQFVATVGLIPASSQDVSFVYSTEDGTATAGNDYAPASGTVTIPAGQTRATVTICINGDTVGETDETFWVNLSDPVGAQMGSDHATATIVDDDDPVYSLSISDAAHGEGSSWLNAYMFFTVTLSQPRARDVSFSYATADGTALAGQDYQAASGTITIRAGWIGCSVMVYLTPDAIVEPDKTFFVRLSNADGAAIANGQATGTILDDDLLLAIDDVRLAEGNSGTKDLVFTVTLSESANKDVTVSYATASQTATEGDDYAGATGTLTIPAGGTSGQIVVRVIGDVTLEPDETFYVDLSNASRATIVDFLGVGTIVNDDPPPDCSRPTANIADPGVGKKVPLQSLNARRYLDVTFADLGSGVDPATILDKAPEFALAGSAAKAIVLGAPKLVGGNSYRYSFGGAFTAGAVTVRFLAGSFADKVGNANRAANQSFMLAASVAIGDALVAEGTFLLSPAKVVFPVTLSAPSTKPVSVRYVTVDGTAKADKDYVATSGTLVVPAGKTTGTILVPVCYDALAEENEIFSVKLLSVTNNFAIARTLAVGTILDDDRLRSLSVSNPQAVGESAGRVAFTVSLSAASGKTVSVRYSTANSTAKAGNDYMATSGQLTFKPGVVSQVVYVPILDDALAEGSEAFRLKLSSPVNATLARAAATATILANDQTAVRAAAATVGASQAAHELALALAAADFTHSDGASRAKPLVPAVRSELLRMLADGRRR
jgi:chitinase